MWDANVGTTDAGPRRGRTRPAAADRLRLDASTCSATPTAASSTRRTGATSADGFLSWYDETKYRAHEVAEARIAARRADRDRHAQPGLRPERPLDHRPSSSARPTRASSGTGRSTTSASAWVHVDDLADGIVAALDRGADRRGVRPARGPRDAASARPSRSRHGSADGGRRGSGCRRCSSGSSPRSTRRGLIGQPRTCARPSPSGEGVTYWALIDKAAARARLRGPRTLEPGCRRHLGRDPA